MMRFIEYVSRETKPRGARIYPAASRRVYVPREVIASRGMHLFDFRRPGEVAKKKKKKNFSRTNPFWDKLLFQTTCSKMNKFETH